MVNNAGIDGSINDEWSAQSYRWAYAILVSKATNDHALELCIWWVISINDDNVDL